VVQWKGYREASRHLHIAQLSISETVAELEQELGLKLFSRAGRMAQLTPEGGGLLRGVRAYTCEGGVGHHR
jgi:DNA-binding transcriptional LysR family regulator